MKLKVAVVFLFAFVFTSTLNAQDAKGWHLLDPQKDKVYGISLSETYNFLKGKKATPVIVAVIDSGIDTAHEDLKNILWTNPKEIPGNGIDDDGNGYVDDVHGWNFLGNKNGQDLEKASDERSRVYYTLKDKFDGKDINEDSLNEDDKWLYDEWKKASGEMTISSDEQMEVMMLEALDKTLHKQDAILQQELGKKEYSLNDLEKTQLSTSKGKKAKTSFLNILKLEKVDR